MLVLRCFLGLEFEHCSLTPETKVTDISFQVYIGFIHFKKLNCNWETLWQPKQCRVPKKLQGVIRQQREQVRRERPASSYVRSRLSTHTPPPQHATCDPSHPQDRWLCERAGSLNPQFWCGMEQSAPAPYGKFPKRQIPFRAWLSMIWRGPGVCDVQTDTWWLVYRQPRDIHHVDNQNLSIPWTPDCSPKGFVGIWVVPSWLQTPNGKQIPLHILACIPTLCQQMMPTKGTQWWTTWSFRGLQPVLKEYHSQAPRLDSLSWLPCPSTPDYLLLIYLFTKQPTLKLP